MIYYCPHCDNSVEIDLQEYGVEYICTGGAYPCGHTFEIEKKKLNFTFYSIPGKCCSCFKDLEETDDGLRCPDRCP